jgi:hypothetical protein
LTQDQVTALLYAVAPNLVKLFIGSCNVFFPLPSLKVIHCRGSPSGEISHLLSIITTSPQLEEVSFGFLDGTAIAVMHEQLQQVNQIKKLVIEEFDEISPVIRTQDLIGRMKNLEHLSVNSSNLFVDDRMFEKHHHLVTVNLTLKLGKSKNTTFTDVGVKFLLQNNHSLKEVTLCGFPLTDLSLEYFEDYIVTHGLEKLTLGSSNWWDFSYAAINKLARTGAENGLQQLTIRSDTREEQIRQILRSALICNLVQYIFSVLLQFFADYFG